VTELANQSLRKPNPAANEDILEFRARNCNTRETAKNSAVAKVA
jgi:hypothetical protein